MKSLALGKTLERKLRVWSLKKSHPTTISIVGIAGFEISDNISKVTFDDSKQQRWKQLKSHKDEKNLCTHFTRFQ